MWVSTCRAQVEMKWCKYDLYLAAVIEVSVRNSLLLRQLPQLIQQDMQLELGLQKYNSSVRYKHKVQPGGRTAGGSRNS